MRNNPVLSSFYRLRNWLLIYCDDATTTDILDQYLCSYYENGALNIANYRTLAYQTQDISGIEHLNYRLLLKKAASVLFFIASLFTQYFFANSITTIYAHLAIQLGLIWFMFEGTVFSTGVRIHKFVKITPPSFNKHLYPYLSILLVFVTQLFTVIFSPYIYQNHPEKVGVFHSSFLTLLLLIFSARLVYSIYDSFVNDITSLVHVVLSLILITFLKTNMIILGFNIGLRRTVSYWALTYIILILGLILAKLFSNILEKDLSQ